MNLLHLPDLTRGLAGKMWSEPKTLKSKKKPPYWRIIQLLRKLRLSYREREKGEAGFHITVDSFGIVFRFNRRQLLANYDGWDIFDVDMETYEKNPIDFGRNLMWILIDKGYMSYLRDPENGTGMIYKRFLVQEGWAERILDRRLEEYKNEPRNLYRIKEITRLRKLPLHYVLTNFPGIFDYSWEAYLL